MDDLVKRLNARLGGVEVPDAMHGDNLAIVLCSFYEDAEGEQDDNGWTEAATKNCEATLEAIRQHYAPLGARIEEWEAAARTRGAMVDEVVPALQARIAELEAERDALLARLEAREVSAQETNDTIRDHAEHLRRLKERIDALQAEYDKSMDEFVERTERG